MNDITMNDSEVSPMPVAGKEPAEVAGEQQGARDLLLATASQIMRDGDQVDISLSELSLRSGLNSALVKYYFGNKAGMLAALLDRDMVAIVRSVDALDKADMPPEEKLRRHISRCIDTYYAVPYLNRLLMRLVRDSDDDEARRVADRYLTPLRVFYERLITAGVAQKVFRQVDPQLFYFTVTGAADRFFSARLVLRHCYGEDTLTEELRDRYREHTVDFIMAGICAPR